ncbi:MAG: hypothetical protein A2284_16285 [Deltaproteobacteria bacterium RIFOXYA12_FULL_61_11]|nr:MAG: hypothetical protein A2284_16285 [Deltaproteobacteria bacterium RIFOXYA12_FULL_61_11]
MLERRSHGLSDRGLKRAANEDCIFHDDLLGLYLVADGMGGHAGGALASRVAVETVVEFWRLTAGDREITWPLPKQTGLSHRQNQLFVGYHLANSAIVAQAERRGLQGMGTTIVALALDPTTAVIAHLGDSRVYRVRDRRIEVLTEDHSLLNDERKRRMMTQAELDEFPDKSVITRALGVEEHLDIPFREEPWLPGDRYLLCSDGLTNQVDAEVLLRMMLEGETPASITESLVLAANAGGGDDNVSAIVVFC